jgi:quinohemoprotein ethanol dehydrogenase
MNGGVLATGGNLVFQGHIDGTFNAYDGLTGKLVWSYAAQAAVMAPPISYSVGGRQYISVLTGNGTAPSAFGSLLKGIHIDALTQAKRVLTFALGGTAALPVSTPYQLDAPADQDFHSNPVAAAKGETLFDSYCVNCHGINAVGQGGAPDLRGSLVPRSAKAFASIVHDGALLDWGMPQFAELTDDQLVDIRAYIRTRAQGLRPR